MTTSNIIEGISRHHDSPGKPPAEPPDIQPRADKVLVRVDHDDRFRRVGSILLDPGAIERPEMLTGVVMRVGPGAEHYDSERDELVRVPVGVEPGERIMFGRGFGFPIEVDGTEFLILMEEHIECAVSGDAELIRGRYSYSESEVA